MRFCVCVFVCVVVFSNSRSRLSHLCTVVPCNCMPAMCAARCQVRVQCCDVISSVPLVFTLSAGATHTPPSSVSLLRSRRCELYTTLPCNGMSVLYTARCQVRVQCCDMISSVPLVFTLPLLPVSSGATPAPPPAAGARLAACGLPWTVGRWSGAEGRSVRAPCSHALPVPSVRARLSVGPCSVNIWVKSVWISSSLFWCLMFLFVCQFVLFLSTQSFKALLPLRHGAVQWHASDVRCQMSSKSDMISSVPLVFTLSVCRLPGQSAGGQVHNAAMPCQYHV